MNLTAEVEISLKSQHQSRNGPARQRRRDRRAAERAAVAADNEAAQTKEAESVKASDVGVATKKDAVEANDMEAARVFEPKDEIENETISDEESEKLCESVSIIPIRNVSSNDDVTEKVIKDKFDEKGILIFGFGIHRSIEGTFIIFDARIGPTSGKLLEGTNFGFADCRAIRIFGN